MKTRINKVGIIVNYYKQEPLKLAEELNIFLQGKEIKVFYPLEEAKVLNIAQGYSREDFCQKVQMLIVLGGDGTLLRAARFVASFQIPILGVNLGNLGFLTEIEKGEIYQALEKIFAAEYRIEKRMMLEAQVFRNNEKIANFCALNDFVINKGSFARLITLEIYLADKLASSYSSDGVIVSTPTGSTAYSLSAGGPIVDPNLNICIITPICPHTLSSRPLVIPPQEMIKIMVRAVRTDAMLTVDGQYGYQLKSDDKILISKAGYTTSLIKIKDQGFFDILQEKFQANQVSYYE